MQIQCIYNKINETLNKYLQNRAEVGFCYIENFLKLTDQVFKNKDLDLIQKITQITILLEALYQITPNNSPLKEDLAKIRLERWESHYGTPTITFLLTFNSQIQRTSVLLKESGNGAIISDKPWEVKSDPNFCIDFENHSVVDPQSLSSISMPSEEEKGKFLKTYNPSGGFTTTPCDFVSQEFIEYAAKTARKGGVALEIGAAFGAASLEALAKGATIFCNDIDPKNLAVVQKRHLKITNSQGSLTGDDNKLILLPGKFPAELERLPPNFFDAVLICRVLHFFSGDQIEKSLALIVNCLKPGGKLFVVCETPYLKNWTKFLPEFEKRKEEGIRWPGEINNPADFESSGRAASLPNFVHWISKEVLDRSLFDSKLLVEHSSYINRSGQFPEDLLLDGRESIGAIAAKP